MIESVVNIYEGLTRYPTKEVDGQQVVDASDVVPHLAESWEVSDDGLTYIFTLREAKSPYGNTLDADDFIFSWDLSAERKDTGNFMRLIGQVDSWEKLNDRQVKVSLKSPNRLFLQSLTTYAPPLIDTKELLKHATDSDPKALEWLKSNTAGYGAYHLDQMRPGEAALFVTNPNYTFDQPYYNRVIYREVPSAANRAALIKSGDVHMAESIPVDQLLDLIEDPNVAVSSTPGTGSATLRMNPKFEPWDDKTVRQAMAHAVNYDAIGDIVFRGTGERARSFLAPIHPGYQEAYRYEYDPVKAKELLASAGYTNGVDVKLEYSENWWWEEALAIQVRDAAAAAGFNVELQRIPKAEMSARRNWKETSLPFFTHLSNAFLLDPAYALKLTAHSDGVSNIMHYRSEEADALIDAMLGETKDQARVEALAGEAQTLLAKDVPIIYTHFPGTHVALNPCIKGWLWRPHNRNVWRELRCE